MAASRATASAQVVSGNVLSVAGVGTQVADVATPSLGQALAALALAVGQPLPFPRRSQLRDSCRLFKLRDGAEDLAHQDSGRGVLEEERGGRRRDEGDPPSP